MLPGFPPNFGEITKKRIRERYDNTLKNNWISGLDEKIDATTFARGEFIYIRFNKELRGGHFFASGPAHMWGEHWYGRIVAVGESVDCIVDQEFIQQSEERRKDHVAVIEAQNESSNFKTVNYDFDPILPFMECDHESAKGIRSLYDPWCSSLWGIHFKPQQQILIHGVELTVVDTGLEYIAGIKDSHPKLRPEHHPHQIKVDTGYLKATNADVYVGYDVQEGLMKHELVQYS